MSAIDEKALLAAFQANHHPDAEPSSVELASLRRSVAVYLSTLAPQQAAPMPGVKVKPLEWDSIDGDWHARPQSGPSYTIQKFHDGWDLLIDGYFVKPRIAGFRETYTLDAAKAAAQADYERRILSALATPEAGTSEREPVAWLWWGKDEAGLDHISFGRWQKHSCQHRYTYAKPQATEHDHPAPAPVDGEAVRALWIDAGGTIHDYGSEGERMVIRGDDLASFLAALAGRLALSPEGQK